MQEVRDSDAKKGRALAAKEQALERKSSACVHAVAAHTGQGRQMLAKKGCLHARDEAPGLGCAPSRDARERMGGQRTL